MHDKKKDTKKFNIFGEISFKWLFCDSIAKRFYFKPNQRSMVKLFAKKGNEYLLLTFFEKSSTINLPLCFPKNTSVACKEKNKLSYIILHNFKNSPYFIDTKQSLHYKVAIE